MSATPIAATNRYFRPETSKVIWCPSVADPSAPTRAEIDAGIDLSDEISEVGGWQVTSDTVETPDLGSRFVGKIPSTTSSDDSSLTMYADEEGHDVRELLHRGDSGNVIWMDEGDVAGQYMDLFPTRVSSVPKQRDLTSAATLQVMFSVVREPKENLIIPA